jgi:signal peptidase I
MKRKLTLFVCGATFIVITWLMTYQTQLLECVSESLHGIRTILVWKDAAVSRGDIVSIKNHPVEHVKATNFAKRILGLPGDSITPHNDILQIGSYRLPLLKQTKDGNPLTPLSAPSVPQGYVFVGGDHPRSFDSRYEEFGLVPFSKIWGKGIATW